MQQTTTLIEKVVVALAAETKAALLRQADLFLAQTSTLHAEIATLRAELAALKTEKTRYRGVWRDGERYERGDLVTDRGLIWHANEDTTARPGSGPAFTMMHKHKSEDR